MFKTKSSIIYFLGIVTLIASLQAEPQVSIGSPDTTSWDRTISAYLEGDASTDIDDLMIVESRSAFYTKNPANPNSVAYFHQIETHIYAPTSESLMSGGPLEWYVFEHDLWESFAPFSVVPVDYHDSYSTHFGGIPGSYSEWINAISLWDNSEEFSVLIYNSKHKGTMSASLVGWDAVDFITYDNLNLLYGGLEYDDILGNTDCGSNYSWATSASITQGINTVSLPAPQTVSTSCGNVNESRIEASADRDHKIYAIIPSLDEI